MSEIKIIQSIDDFCERLNTPEFVHIFHHCNVTEQTYDEALFFEKILNQMVKKYFRFDKRFKVLRTSGVIENDWLLLKFCVDRYSCLVYVVMSGSQLEKTIPFEQFLKLNYNNEKFMEMYNDVLEQI